MSDFQVTAVADGDTITVPRDRGQVWVTLSETDEPGKAPPFGNSSRESLSDLCFNETAKLDDNGKDR